MPGERAFELVDGALGARTAERRVVELLTGRPGQICVDQRRQLGPLRGGGSRQELPRIGVAPGAVLSDVLGEAAVDVPLKFSS